MVGSQPTQEADFASSMERIFQMFEQLTSQNLAVQKSIIDLTEQIKQDRTLLEASHNKLTDPAKQIELPSSQSSGEDFPLDESTSKEEVTLSINDKEPEVDAGEIMDDNHISKFHGVPQEKKVEGRTEMSTLEEKNGSHTDGEPQLRVIANHNRQVASFRM
ncbi:hypothetical protein ACLB2K_007319 [Fragaria x ananassa]